MASLSESAPEASVLGQEVLRQVASAGEPCNPGRPDLGRELEFNTQQGDSKAKIFMCFNGERHLLGTFRDPVTGTEREIQIVAHINITNETSQSQLNTQPDRFYWLTADDEVILREDWPGRAEQSRPRVLEPVEIAELIETITQS